MSSSSSEPRRGRGLGGAWHRTRPSSDARPTVSPVPEGNARLHQTVPPPPRKQPSQGPPHPPLVLAPLIRPFKDALGIWPPPSFPTSDPEERMFSHSGGGEVTMVRRRPQEGLGKDGDFPSAQARERGGGHEG